MKTATSIEETNKTIIELQKLFKNLLKGSYSAKYLSIIYVILSFILAYKYRSELTYSIPLIFSGIIILVFTLKVLWLKNIKANTSTTVELLNNIKRYKYLTEQRGKYEQHVLVFWIFTLVPVYLDGKDITVFLVLKMIVVFYLFIIMGTLLFNNFMKKLEEMDNLINQL